MNGLMLVDEGYNTHRHPRELDHQHGSDAIVTPVMAYHALLLSAQASAEYK